MITNSNRSGFVRVGISEKPQRATHDDVRSGTVSDEPKREERKSFGAQKQKKIISVDGRLQIVDA